MKSRILQGMLSLVLVSVLTLPAHAFWETAAASSAAQTANRAPTAAAVEGETYPDVMIELPLSATDPDGDAVLLKLDTPPSYGTASISSGTLQYTPTETGTDRFTYLAIDTFGNASEPAEITVHVTRNKAKLTYADMNHNAAHYAALQLAAKGVMTGEQVGTAYFFHPDEPVTRSEFIAMTAALAGLPIEETTQTDFADDSGLSDWAKPYISAAAAGGLVSGYPTASGACEIRGQNPITLAEACVMLRGLLGDSSASVQTAALDVSYAPAWAQDACAVLTSADILPESMVRTNSGQALTREEACLLLYRTALQIENL